MPQSQIAQARATNDLVMRRPRNPPALDLGLVTRSAIGGGSDAGQIEADEPQLCLGAARLCTLALHHIQTQQKKLGALTDLNDEVQEVCPPIAVISNSVGFSEKMRAWA